MWVQDVMVPLKKLPLSFTHPALAFANPSPAPVITYLSDPDGKKSNLAAILIWMYCEEGAINSVAPDCPYGSLCSKGGKMVFDTNDLDWHCYGSHHIGNAGKTTQHEAHTEMLKHSKFFGSKEYGINIAKTQIGAFTKFLVYYCDDVTSVKSAWDFCRGQTGIKSKSKGYIWAVKFRSFCGEIRKAISLNLGSTGSTVEIDNTFYKHIWKYHKMSMPHSWHDKSWLRIIERDYTLKGRHRRRTFIVGQESTKQCLDLIAASCAKHRKIKLMADGCSYGNSKEMQEMREHFIVQQCNHQNSMFVQPGTEYLDAHNKVHDNTTEASFQRDKLKHKSMYGLTSNIELARGWLWESDFRNNYTDMSTMDTVQQFVQFVCQILPAHFCF